VHDCFDAHGKRAERVGWMIQGVRRRRAPTQIALVGPLGEDVRRRRRGLRSGSTTAGGPVTETALPCRIDVSNSLHKREDYGPECDTASLCVTLHNISIVSILLGPIGANRDIRVAVGTTSLVGPTTTPAAGPGVDGLGARFAARTVSRDERDRGGDQEPARKPPPATMLRTIADLAPSTAAWVPGRGSVPARARRALDVGGRSRRLTADCGGARRPRCCLLDGRGGRGGAGPARTSPGGGPTRMTPVLIRWSIRARLGLMRRTCRQSPGAGRITLWNTVHPAPPSPGSVIERQRDRTAAVQPAAASWCSHGRTRGRSRISQPVSPSARLKPRHEGYAAVAHHRPV
jgi:hypothetical protein